MLTVSVVFLKMLVWNLWIWRLKWLSPRKWRKKRSSWWRTARRKRRKCWKRFVPFLFFFKWLHHIKSWGLSHSYRFLGFSMTACNWAAFKMLYILFFIQSPSYLVRAATLWPCLLPRTCALVHFAHLLWVLSAFTLTDPAELSALKVPGWRTANLRRKRSFRLRFAGVASRFASVTSAKWVHSKVDRD